MYLRSTHSNICIHHPPSPSITHHHPSHLSINEPLMAINLPIYLSIYLLNVYVLSALIIYSQVWKSKWKKQVWWMSLPPCIHNLQEEGERLKLTWQRFLSTTHSFSFSSSFSSYLFFLVFLFILSLLFHLFLLFLHSLLPACSYL